MSSLGSISVTFTANAAGFTKAIRAATQDLQAFGNVARLASTAGQPFQSTIGGMGTVVSGASANLKGLSMSAVDSTSRMNLLQAATAQGQTTLSSFGAGIGNVSTNLGGLATASANVAQNQDNMIKMTQRTGESMAAFTSRVDTHTKSMQSGIPAGHQLQSSYRLMGNGALQASTNIVKANNTSIMSMLSFSNMLGKIIHYITFSIGVQMVMGVTRGIKALITTMTDFQKECVRTAGVAGRLGGAFEQTVKDIGAVSMELGRTTIFKASEAAHAMYDLASAGFDVAAAMSSIESGVAIVGPILDYAAAQQIELSDATASVSRALKMFDLDLDESMSVVDTFTAAIANSFLTAEKLADGLRYSGAMAHVLGVSLNETVASLMSLSDAGLTGSQSGQRLNMIMTKLLKPTEQAKKTLADLGLTMEDISPQTQTLSEIFQTLRAAGFGAAEAASFFRARTAGAAAALIDNADEMERYRQTLIGAEGMTKELAERQEQTLWGSFKLVSAAVESLALKFGELLMPALMDMTAFIKSGVVPAVEQIVAGLKMGSSIIGPIIPMLKWFAAGLGIVGIMMSLLWIKIKLVTLATRMWNTVLKANPIMLVVSVLGMLLGAILGFMDSIGILGPMIESVGKAFERLIEWIKGGIDWFNNLGPVVQNLISIIFPFIGIIRVLTEVFKDDYAEQRKMYEYMGKLKGSTDKYLTTLDSLVETYDKEIAAQKKVNKLASEENANLIKLGEAKADLAEATDDVAKSEEAFYAASAQLFKMIASLTEGLNLYVEALGKLDAVQDRITSKQNEQMSNLKDITELEEDLADATNRYGVSSQEVLDIEDDLYKKYKDKIDLSKEVIDLGGEEVEEIDKKFEAYKKLGIAEREIADLSEDLYVHEEDRKDLELEMIKLIAKKNVLMSTRNNFERYFKEGIDKLRDAEEKLYDIELKIYKLRHGVTDTYREMFDALASEGLVTQEIIADYKDLEIAEGNALKEKIEYSRAIESLSTGDRQSVTEWTESYTDALNEGLTADQARIEANKKVGISLSTVNGLTVDGVREILEYAHAQHIADDMNKKIGGSIMTYAGSLFDANQLGEDAAGIYIAWKKNVDELAKSYEDLITINEEVDNSMIGLIRRTSILFQYYKEHEDYGDDVVKTTVGMAESMGILGAVGKDEMAILKRLNGFYDESRSALEDYTQAEINAALTSMKWAKYKEGYEPETITADDIVDATAIDSFTEFTAIAQKEVSDIALEFDGVTDAIISTVDKIKEMISQIEILIEKISLANAIEPPKSNWQKFTDTMGAGWENITQGRGVHLPFNLDRLIPIYGSVAALIDLLAVEAKNGMVALASGITRTKGPTNALIGENGAEAVVPLEGINKKYGRRILEEILPKYYPDLIGKKLLHMQRGGMVGSGTHTIPISTTNNDTTEIHVHGDVIVQNPANYDEFYDELLRRLGKSKKLVP